MKNVFLFIILCISDLGWCQTNNDFAGVSSFQKYDESFITPFLRGKHAVSLGGIIGVYGPQISTLFNGNSNS